MVVCSLRNKRSGLSGRPPCKGVAIGVARRGARLGGERTLRIPPSCSLPVSHVGGPHVAKFAVGRSCTCVRAGAGARVRVRVCVHFCTPALFRLFGAQNRETPPLVQSAHEQGRPQPRPQLCALLGARTRDLAVLDLIIYKPSISRARRPVFLRFERSGRWRENAWLVASPGLWPANNRQQSMCEFPHCASRHARHGWRGAAARGQERPTQRLPFAPPD